MYNRLFIVAIAPAAAAAAQPIAHRAAIVGAANPNAGQCTVTVVVDGQAEIEIRGANATMHDLGGASPQWRSFECTSAMPPNPADFRFAGLNGRSHQNLVTEPRNGGARRTPKTGQSSISAQRFTDEDVQRVYDGLELSEVIDSLQLFVESTRVAPRDRNILAEDRKRLVEFSSHHDGYSTR
jgi:hypothetical protein